MYKLYDRVTSAIAAQSLSLQSAFAAAFLTITDQVSTLALFKPNEVQSATSNFINSAVSSGSPLSVQAAFEAGANWATGRLLDAVGNSVTAAASGQPGPGTGSNDTPLTSGAGQAAYVAPPVLNDPPATVIIPPTTGEPSPAPLAEALKETAQSPNDPAAG
jgi:hypothetical protein